MQLQKSEILIIVAIISASYLFSMDEVKFLDTQLMFILITLGIVIIYKLMYIEKMKNLRQANNIDSEENFHVGIPSGGLSEYAVAQKDESTDYIKKEEYEKLQEKLNKLQEQIGTMYQRSNVSDEKPNSIKELIHDSDKIDKKIKERTQDINELKAMIVKNQNEYKENHEKIKYYNSVQPEVAKVDYTKSNAVDQNFKNMVSDADGGITEFKNTTYKNSGNSRISKSKMQNTENNSNNQQNKTQLHQLINHIKQNGIQIKI